ncbi:MAG: glycosyltransferase family 2 protein [Chitinispirillaceae bacterium]
MIRNWPEDTFILIPSYKSVGPLNSFLEELFKTVPKKQITVVDDASGDGTDSLCSTLGIDCLIHNENKGKGAALDTGFTHLIQNKSARWILTMDADGQHSPSDIHLFLEQSQKEPPPGLVIGARSMKLGIMPPARICSNKLTSGFLSLLADQKIEDSQCGYRLYSSKLLNSITIDYKRFEMETEVILKAAHNSFPIRFVPVQTLYLSGPSHISHLLDTVRWIRAVVNIWTRLRFKKLNH